MHLVIAQALARATLDAMAMPQNAATVALATFHDAADTGDHEPGQLVGVLLDALVQGDATPAQRAVLGALLALIGRA